MKHAFIFGTNLYLTEGNTVTYADQNRSVEFLKILSFYHAENNKQLVVDAHIQTPDGMDVPVLSNSHTGSLRLTTDANRVRLYSEGHHEPVLDVYQLDPHEYDGLSSHILNEIHAQHPDFVVTVKGNFMVDGCSIIFDNEKMYICGDSTANGVNNAHEGIILTPDKVWA